MVKFLWQEKKGRNEIKKEIKNINLSVTVINDQLERARRAKEISKNKQNLLASANDKVVLDVESNKVLEETFK